MNCDETSRLLDAYADQELFLKDSLEIEKHLKNCLSCKQKHTNLLLLQGSLRQFDKYLPGPNLQEKIQHAIDKEVTPGARRWQNPWLRIATPSFAAGIAASLVIYIGFVTPHPSSSLSNELKASHVRSLMVSHLVDKSSADKHQIKPWLHTMIDFSPVVEDLEVEGFALQGARLDYIQNGQAVALVYKTRNHPINLFIWPARDANETTATLTVENFHGYSIQSWGHSSLNYAAVSDLNPSELTLFVERYQIKINAVK